LVVPARARSGRYSPASPLIPPFGHSFLEDKGQIRHEEQGLRYVYMPKDPRHKIQQSALKHLVETLFEGSAEKVVAALLGKGSSGISEDQLERMSKLIEKAKKEGKHK
jgi:BlaI family penicillinase repressor